MTESKATDAPPVKKRAYVRIKILSMGPSGNTLISFCSRPCALGAGEGNVGKSCLIKRYCEGKVCAAILAGVAPPAHDQFRIVSSQFVSKYISTIGVDFGVKPVMVDDVEVKVNFWDLSGHPEFFQVRNEFYKDTQAVRLRCSHYIARPCANCMFPSRMDATGAAGVRRLVQEVVSGAGAVAARRGQVRGRHEAARHRRLRQQGLCLFFTLIVVCRYLRDLTCVFASQRRLIWTSGW
jgi:hypothetical protein